MADAQKFYIVKRPAGNCDIVSGEPVPNSEEGQIVEQWGPFESPDEALARRVGLIRAGKCQPQ
ncbi:MAG: DDE transposase family protein [Lyngbya sp.]|nr:DDE transposase family protein [Lyngbya sp.]